MRIKFEKGMTPEAISRMFVDFIRERELVIGAVNVYIQTYDNDMQPEQFRREREGMFVCKPSDETKHIYEEEVANIRRKKFKAIV